MNKVRLTRTQSQIIKLVLWLQIHLSEKKEKKQTLKDTATTTSRYGNVYLIYAHSL